MVKALLIFWVLGAFNLFANETSFTVESGLTKKTFALKISTTQIFQASCELGVVRMNITRANGFQQGVIDLQVLATNSCTPTPGPHSMIFRLPRGNALPEIPNGFYQILINGETHQIIDVFPDRGSETGNG